MTDHDCEPLDPCPVCEADKAAYDQGRADERAAIVAWLIPGAWCPVWPQNDKAPGLSTEG